MYFIRRLSEIIPALLVVSLLTFLLVRIAPGGPFDAERAPASPEIERRLMERYHLDEPVWKQYGRFVIGAIQGDFGPSMKYRDHSVQDIIRQGLPVTLSLGAMAFVVAVAVGVPWGIWLARSTGTIWGRFGNMGALIALCSPPIVVGPLLLSLFAVRLGWAPVAFWDSVSSFVLPVATLAIFYSGRVAQLTREGTLEAMSADYRRVAVAKGVPARRVFGTHLFPASVAPAVSYSAPMFADLLTGSFVVENLFQIPGVGVFLVNSSLNRDYPMVVGLALLYAFLLLVLSVVSDWVLSRVDPRVRF